tara:strand:- start:20 stop:595 length:576 start_codon:yes stop_codon:yes gene_type:complete
MNEFEAYRLYLSIKQHFTLDNYDAFKYNFKTPAKRSSFETRRDKWHFYRLSKKEDPKGYLVANAVEGNIHWIGDVNSPKGEAIYKEWKIRQQSLSYRFKTEIALMNDDFNANFYVKDGQHPPLFKQYRQGDISIETMVILNHLVKYLNYWKKEIQDPIIWPEVMRLFLKYRPFLKCDVFGMKKILKERFDA